MERPTILVVDDEDGVRMGTRRLLERAGYQVIDAASAIDAMNRHRDASFDVLLTDMMMPGGKSGRIWPTRCEAAGPGCRWST